MFDDMQYDAFQWCVDNDILVYCLPRKRGEKKFAIEVDIRGNKTKSDKIYDKKQVDAKIWELYCHLYLKYNVK